MQIVKDTVVTLQYELRRDDAKGELLDQTSDDKPLAFLYGGGQVLPEFENQLMGKEAGMSFDFDIASEDAYGAHLPEALIDLPMETFREAPPGLLAPGQSVPFQDQNGNLLNGKILEVGEEVVKVDFNHPLAGVNLHFSGQIKSVRAATPEELAHGHVHGPGGHQH